MNVADIFKVNHLAIKGCRHILLIDDVSTTGSTLIEAVERYVSVIGGKVTLAVLAIA